MRTPSPGGTAPRANEEKGQLAGGFHGERRFSDAAGGSPPRPALWLFVPARRRYKRGMPLLSYRNTLAGNPLDRASERRGDAAWIAERLGSPDAQAVVLWNGQPLLREGEAGGRTIAFVSGRLAEELAAGPERLLFMGLRGEAPVFAVDVEGEAEPVRFEALGAFQDLRKSALALPPEEAAIAATAKQMFEWRRRHRFCAACGHPSEPADGGWKRQCPACRVEHFPRTDPVVIMLPHHNGRCMLGRSPHFPPGVFSALAGFLEPGETIEEACARELREEAGLRAVRVHYHSSQPWPWPSSLMIGLLAEVEDDQAAPDQTELSEVRWFTKAEARDLLARRLEGVWAPDRLAIAHHLIRAWAGPERKIVFPSDHL